MLLAKVPQVKDEKSTLSSALDTSLSDLAWNVFCIIDKWMIVHFNQNKRKCCNYLISITPKVDVKIVLKVL